ncbi:MAG: NCS2 family permease [Lachnospiraceae bacterium]|nr:NCS2 family permease [Lachnospiraceae bacterium]
MTAFLNKFFKLEEKGTTIKTEVLAGITTFATMAYILAVNANILSAAGLDQGAVFVATAIASVVGTVAMALLANLPFAVAPGMGLNAFFAYTVVIGMGFSPQLALAAIFTEGILFIILSKSGIRTALFNSIPMTLKYAVGAGIGLFILFIGLKNAGVVIADGATFVTMGSLKNAAPALCLIGVVFTIILMLKKVKGALLIGIVATWLLGIMAQLFGWYQVDVTSGAYDLVPNSFIDLPPSLAPTWLLFIEGFKEVFNTANGFFTFLSVTLTFLFIDIFDTVGTLAGLASKAKMLDAQGRLEKSDEALLADALSTSLGAALGTSTTTTYIESASGVQEGGRTGLTAMVVAGFFAISLFFAPIFLTIPAFATATALVVVGVLMLEPIGNLKLDSLEDLIPLGITIVTMPLFFSISHGLAFGFISYVVVKAAAGKFKDISILMWILAILFLLQMVLAG